MALLRGVIDPELGSDIVDLGMAKGVEVEPDGQVTVTIALTTAGCPLRAQIQRDVEARIASIPGVTGVQLRLDRADARREGRRPWPRPAGTSARSHRRPRCRPPPACSTDRVRQGWRGQVVGHRQPGRRPSPPRASPSACSTPTSGASRCPACSGSRAACRAPSTGERKIAPNEKPIGRGHLEVVSMGLLVDDEGEALMWRGLMLNRAVQHFLEDVAWGDLDYLLIDMPPGTGDVQMGLARMLPRAEMIIVTTPAVSAQKVADPRRDHGPQELRARRRRHREHERLPLRPRRRVRLVRRGRRRRRWPTTPACPLLGQIPLEPSVAAGGDAGEPVALGTARPPRRSAPWPTCSSTEAAPPVTMAGCSARMLDAAVAALDLPPGDEPPGRLRRSRYQRASGFARLGRVCAGLDLARRACRGCLRGSTGGEQSGHRRQALGRVEPVALVGEARVLVVG